MSAKRGASGLSGVLLVDKPQGLTSHDVVGRVRRITGERRVGHAGTLDPMATGLLVVLVGPATRLAPYLTAAEKRYIARITFGAQTNTDDAEGEPIATALVPAELADPEFARARVAELVGVHEQVPPAFSAIKRDGVTAYKAARAGEAIELEARTIEVVDARLIAVDTSRVAVAANTAADAAGAVSADAPDEVGGTVWEVELSVSKGTYIRSIARDLGVSLGTVAHLSALRRTSSGAYSVEDAATLEELEQDSASGSVPQGDAMLDAREAAPELVARWFADPLRGLALPVVRVNEAGAVRVSTGSTLDAALHCLDYDAADGSVAVRYGDRLLAIYQRVESSEGSQVAATSQAVLKPQVVIAGGVSGVADDTSEGCE